MIVHHRARLRARLLLGAAAGLGLSLASESAIAQQGQLSITANVVAQCSVVSGGATLNFGTYDPNDSEDTEADTFFDVTCTAGTGVEVSLDGGENGVGGRKLTDGSTPQNLLSYRLWQDSVGGVEFGNGSIGIPKTINVSSGSPTRVDVFGNIIAGQPVPAGEYTDTVQITLSVLAPTS